MKERGGERSREQSPTVVEEVSGGGLGGDGHNVWVSGQSGSEWGKLATLLE